VIRRISASFVVFRRLPPSFGFLNGTSDHPASRRRLFTVSVRLACAPSPLEDMNQTRVVLAPVQFSSVLSSTEYRLGFMTSY